MERRHSDVLIAGLILVGAMLWLFNLVGVLSNLGEVERLAVWATAGIVASQISRRVFVEQELGTTVIAAGVAAAISIGILVEIRGEAIHQRDLLRIGVTMVGALAGSLLSRRRRQEVWLAWRVLAAGFASFGSLLIAYGLLHFADPRLTPVFVLVGPLLASLIVALRIGVHGVHTAWGTALVIGTLALGSALGFEAVLGALFGGLIAGVGGAMGARIRESRTRNAEPHLPEAHVQ